MRRALPWIGLVLLAALPVLSADPVWLHLATLVGLWTLFGISFNVIWGYAGQFSMGQIGLGAVSAYVTAILVMQHSWPFWLAVGAGIVLAVMVSIVVGLLTLRLSGFYFAIMTLAVVLILLAVASSLTITGRTTGLTVLFNLGSIDLGIVSWNLDSRRGGFFLLLVVTVVVVLVAFDHLLTTRLGRGMAAIREDEVLASSLGVPAARYKITAFAISAVIAGLAGAFHATYFRLVSPTLYGFSALITLIVMLVVGGAGRRFGPLIGATVYIAAVEGVRFGGELRAALFGVVLIGIVLFAPEGIGGLWDRLMTRWRPESARDAGRGLLAPPTALVGEGEERSDVAAR